MIRHSTMANKQDAVPVASGTVASTSQPNMNTGSVKINIIMNILSSVALVNVNKLLVTYGFTYILLLTACHFLTGYVFLHLASSEKWNLGLFTRPTPLSWAQTLPIAAAGIGSIALMNYSLRFNSVGTYQILKVAVLPATMGLSFLQRIATPTLKEVAAASFVVLGALVCTASDVKITSFGVLVGIAAVLATAQYQIYQQTVQSRNKLNSTQAMYAISLPQAVMTFVASIFFETSWADRVYAPTAASALVSTVHDIWSHPYSVTEIAVIGLTCALAVLLNYSTIAVIGKTDAVTMQFVNQVKTVLIVAISFFLFPQKHSFFTISLLVGGLCLVFMGVGYYTKLKQAAVKLPTVNPTTK